MHFGGVGEFSEGVLTELKRKNEWGIGSRTSWVYVWVCLCMYFSTWVDEGNESRGL